MAPPTEEIIVRSRFDDIPIPDVDYSTALNNQLTKNPDRVALIDVASGKELRCSEVKSIIETIASNLRRLGVSPLDTAAIFSSNSVEYALVVSAFLRLGARVALINALSTSGELRKYIDLCDATYLYTTQELAQTALEGIDSAALAKNVIVKGSYRGCTSLSDLMKSSNPISLPDLKSLHIDPTKDVMAILFSSGTTGMPKAVSLSHKNMQAVYEQTNSPSVRLHGERRTMLIYQPLSHIFGFALLTGGLVKGNICCVVNKFDLNNYLAAIEKYRIEAFVVVPPIAVLLAKSPLVDKFDLSCVKELQNGGAPIKEETEKAVLSRIPNCNMARQGYGLTETASIVCGGPFPGARNVPRKIPMGSVGMLLPCTEAKVVDPDTGKTLGPNQDGELWFRGPQNMLGYLKNPDATRNTLDKDGFLHTGDIGHYDEDGFFFVVDRLKELIKYKAYQVAPAELEALILSHPKVEDVGVIGIPDQVGGEIPLAWVVPKPEIQLAPQDIITFVDGKVAPYKKLRGGVKFVQSIPKSPSGKILRRLMRDQTAISSKL